MKRRRALLLSYVQRAEQTILTATDPAMFADEFLQQATIINVTGGRLALEQEGRTG